MSLETMTKLATYTVPSGGVAAVDFVNIPQEYTDLKVVFSTRTSNSNVFGFSYVYFNGSQTGYAQRVIEGTGASVSSYVQTSTYAFNDDSVGNSSTAQVFGNSDLYIANYSGSTFKNFSVDSGNENNATTAYYQIASGVWSNSAPITRLTFSTSSTSLSGGSPLYMQHSTFTLYGIKNEFKTAGNSIKATGGKIIFDGTYVYHAFTSTGAFVPTQTLLTDMLVVGGGAGGGGGRSGNHYGGGGGSGAALTFASQYLNLGSYAVTVGAGGAGGTNSASYSQGTNGSSSQFGALTVATGGGGGGSGNTVGLAGASGGGGGGFSNTSPAGGAGNQGFAGGAGAAAYRGGGGGGAGAAGSNGNANAGAGGPGGIGLTSTLINALCSATGVGQNVGGTWYVAGGGAGTPEGSLGGFGGGGAGMDTTLPITRGFGVAGTGGGGGGGTAGAPAEAGGTGGSGVVIIRYKG